MHDGQDVPANRVGAEHVPKETGDVPESVCFVAMDGIVVLRKGGFKLVDPEAVELGEAFTDEPVELGVGSLL